MSYVVYWQGHENGKYVVKRHGEFSSLDVAKKSIEHWWHIHNFKPPYIRVIEDDSCITIDYGSHTNFYKIQKEGIMCGYIIVNVASGSVEGLRDADIFQEVIFEDMDEAQEYIDSNNLNVNDMLIVSVNKVFAPNVKFEEM